jgi:hypothetical protein
MEIAIKIYDFFVQKNNLKWTSPIQIYDYDIFLRIKKHNGMWKSPIKIYDFVVHEKNDMEIPYQNLWCLVH